MFFGVSDVSLQHFTARTPEFSDFKLALENNDGMDTKFPEFCIQNYTGCVGFFFLSILYLKGTRYSFVRGLISLLKS